MKLRNNLLFALSSVLFCQSALAALPAQKKSPSVTKDTCGYKCEKIKKEDSDTDKLKKLLSKSLPDKITGALMLDYANYHWDKTRMGNGAELRRGRIGVEGSPYKNWGYNFLYDFGKNSPKVIYAFLTYTGFDRWNISIGQSKVPFSLEVMTSSKYTTFLERSLESVFAPFLLINVKANTYGNLTPKDTYSFAASIFGNEIGSGNNNERDEPTGIGGRGTYTYSFAKDRLIEFGLSGALRKPDSDKTLSFSTRPESNVTDVRLANTGTITSVNHYKQYGLEAVGIHGPFSLQGEYIGNYIDRTSGMSNLFFKGWYLQGSWFLTGESRPFDPKEAVFTRVKPCARYGAVELAARLSHINLDDDAIRGGRENDMTLGVNWYANPYVRFMFNYIKVYSKKSGVSNDPSIYTVRAQIDF